ncbi:hypothetical protein C798_15890 [Herbaspirillum rubrisubalbicans Os34]|uniref:DUF4150 domain-containing protein n=1 Tax=Herbaspirillum rubrisubalbicans Os34 TaxID=1235827 RepID=A0A6M3ZSQ6_9BURK|nr:PAAR-like domain-containing protein [Herbaspirillum rubrisubalbicans]QJQ01665.1 hypothetical protein C798_15890 [Herbaspirillum rubrisubalbicans Os34]
MPTAARKNGIFKAVSLVPNVCKTPMGPNMVPVPYPVIADLSDSVQVAKSVRFNGDPVFLFGDSLVTRVTGNEAGTGARSKLGPLEPHEIYGFEPAIVLGGKIRLENLAKVNANVHLTILRQFAEPELPLSGIDIEKLLDS